MSLIESVTHSLENCASHASLSGMHSSGLFTFVKGGMGGSCHDAVAFGQREDMIEAARSMNVFSGAICKNAVQREIARVQKDA